MGSLHAQEFATSVALGEINLEAALDWHLSENHYPPVPRSFIPVCLKAIEWANLGRWNEKVALPPGCYYRGASEAPVSAIVEQHHLDAFLDQEEA